MKLLAAIAAVVLAGCATQSPGAVTVEWRRVDLDKVDSVCAKEHGEGAIVVGHYRGCSRWNRDAATCTIWVPDFRLEERESMATLGHEIKHCFDGLWH